jgi:hypothetical protein
MPAMNGASCFFTNRYIRLICFYDEVRDIRTRGVLGAHDNKAGIGLNKSSLLRSSVADIFVTADRDPAFLADELQPGFIVRILRQVIVMYLAGNSGCAQPVSQNMASQISVDEKDRPGFRRPGVHTG